MVLSFGLSRLKGLGSGLGLGLVLVLILKRYVFKSDAHVSNVIGNV